MDDIRTTNRARILELLLQRDTVSRKELSQRLVLTNATISRITKELIAEGVCCEGKSYQSGNQLGRHQTDIFINPEGGFVIAICISAFSRIITITDISGKTHHEAKIPLQAVKSPKSAIEFISNYVEELTKNGALNRKKVLGAALAIAGSINIETGYLKQAPLLKWRNYPFGEHLTERLGCPVRVENIADTLCLNYLERTGLEDDPYMNIFLIHVAIGMGASLAIDRRIVRKRGNEGLIGKTPALWHSDKLIRLDEISSGEAILQRLEGTRNLSNDTHSNITKRFQSAVDSCNKNSVLEKEIFLEAGKTLGASLMALTVTFSPDIIVLAGPAVAAEAFCEGITNTYREISKGTDAETTKFLINKTSYIEATINLALREYLCADIVR